MPALLSRSVIHLFIRLTVGMTSYNCKHLSLSLWGYRASFPQRLPPCDNVTCVEHALSSSSAAGERHNCDCTFGRTFAHKKHMCGNASQRACNWGTVEHSSATRPGCASDLRASRASCVQYLGTAIHGAGLRLPANHHHQGFATPKRTQAVEHAYTQSDTNRPRTPHHTTHAFMWRVISRQQNV